MKTTAGANPIQARGGDGGRETTLTQSVKQTSGKIGTVQASGCVTFYKEPAPYSTISYKWKVERTAEPIKKPNHPK